MLFCSDLMCKPSEPGKRIKMDFECLHSRIHFFILLCGEKPQRGNAKHFRVWLERNKPGKARQDIEKLEKQNTIYGQA